MPSDSGTVIAVKSALLRSQIRILTQPLQPGDKWRDGSDIPRTVLQDAMNDVNRTLRRHSDTVFYPMAIRAVAHQIDQLYLESTAPSSSEDAPDFDVGQLDDLSREKTITRLPDSWDNSSEYIQLLGRLQSLSARRTKLQMKLETFKQLHSLTERFRDAQSSIQPNLVTRDGPLTKELEKTRELGVRLAGALAGRKRKRDRQESG